MFRLSGFFFLFIAVGCGALLFWTSQSVQRAEQRLVKVQQSNDAEQETLRVLSAEWDYLNRPERLETLTLGNLGMENTHVDDGDFVNASEAIPQPIVPVLPKMKPAFLRDVSISKGEGRSPSQESVTIDKTERESFDRLIDGFSKGGAKE